jgi:hypothetical protein
MRHCRWDLVLIRYSFPLLEMDTSQSVWKLSASSMKVYRHDIGVEAGVRSIDTSSMPRKLRKMTSLHYHFECHQSIYTLHEALSLGFGADTLQLSSP